jgi:hypothetical protein
VDVDRGSRRIDHNLSFGVARVGWFPPFRAVVNSGVVFVNDNRRQLINAPKDLDRLMPPMPTAATR